MMPDVERTVDQHDQAADAGGRTLSQMREVWPSIIGAMREASPDVRVVILRFDTSGIPSVIDSTDGIDVETPPLWLARGLEQRRRAAAANASIPLEGGGSIIHMREVLRTDDAAVVVFALAPADLRVGRLDGASLLDLACSAPASVLASSERLESTSRLASIHAIASVMERIHAARTLAAAAHELTEAAAARVDGGATLVTIRRDDIERVLPERALTDASVRLIRACAAAVEVRRSSGMAAIPMRTSGAPEGVFAVLLATSPDEPDAEMIDWLTLLTTAAAGPMARLRRASMPLRDRVAEGLVGVGRWVVRPERGVLKIAVLLLLVAAGLLWFVRVPKEATGHGVVAPGEERVVAATLSQPLESIDVAPGDQLVVGDVLARHDTSERAVSLEETRAELASLQRRVNAALEVGDDAIASELRAQLRSVRADAALLEALLEAGVLRSPVDGVVVSAPESAALGVTPAAGDALFRISGGGDRIIRARVAVADARSVNVGAPGRFATVARPDDWMNGVVTRVDRIGDGGACVVEISFEDGEAPIGLEGEVRLRLGSEPLGMRLLRPVVAWWRRSIPL